MPKKGNRKGKARGNDTRQKGGELLSLHFLVLQSPNYIIHMTIY